jgi:hypothetical protein
VIASGRQIGKELKNQEAMRHREEICGKKICTSRRVVKVELDQVDQVMAKANMALNVSKWMYQYK